MEQSIVLWKFFSFVEFSVYASTAHGLCLAEKKNRNKNIADAHVYVHFLFLFDFSSFAKLAMAEVNKIMRKIQIKLVYLKNCRDSLR